MEVFTSLGERIEREWREHRHDELLFPGIAERALREASLPACVDPRAIVRFAMESDRLPRPQENLEATFGEPPVTLFVSAGFAIEALFWLNATTSIHSHAFSGAFAVLAGSSLHHRHRFHTAERIHARLFLGTLASEGVELLRAGDCRAIRSRDQSEPLIHALFHLSRPSVSIVVRTRWEQEPLPQLRFLPPSLAVASFYSEDQHTRRLQLLEMLAACSADEYREALIDLIGRADLLTAVLALERAARAHLESDEELAPFLDALAKRHPSLAAALPAALREARRNSRLIELRSVVTDPDQRFFLALLLNISSREEILELVRREFPDTDPVDRVMKWIGELPFGLELEEAALVVLRGLIEGLDFEAIKARLVQDYSAEEVERQADALRELHDDLRAVERLAPLFSPRG